MYNFTHSPGGQKFGNIWISGGTKKPPILPYTNLYGFVIDDSAMRCPIYADPSSYLSALSNVRQYTNTRLVESTTNYKIYEVDNYVMWDTTFDDVSPVLSNVQNGFLDHYDYGYMDPRGIITYFGSGEKMGIQYDLNGNPVYNGNGETLRAPFCYRIVGRYIRYASMPETPVPSESDILSKISTLKEKLGTYNDSSIRYAGCPQEVLQPGVTYHAPELPNTASYSAPTETSLSMLDTVNGMKYVYRKGAVTKSMSGVIDWQIVNPLDIDEYFASLDIERMDRAIAAYINPYRLMIYPIVPYIVLKDDEDWPYEPRLIYDKMQKGKYYGDFKSLSFEYNYYPARVYAYPTPTILETSGEDELKLEADGFNRNLIDLRTNFIIRKSSIENQRITKRLGIKYNIRKQLYKVPIDTFVYKQGSSEYNVVMLSTGYGFNGYISLFEVHPSLLPT